LIRWANALASFLFLVPAAGAEQKTFIGGEACGACHPAILARQSASGHAHSLSRVPEHPLAGRFATPLPLERPPAFRLQLLINSGQWRFRADDGRYASETPVEWAFGAGDQAVTFLSKVAADYYLELSLSYFADTGSLDLTPRHDLLPSHTLNEAMGQPIATRTAGVTCFGCHSTGPVTVSPAGEIRITERGVRCEVCHGPGSAHRAAALGGKIGEARKLIDKPGGLTGGALNDFCGRCHRVTGNLAGIDWQSPWSVRHQPPYLARSRCFQESGGKLSCLTCHDPHDPVRRQDAAYYRARCVSCHRAGDHAPKKICLKEQPPNCVRCHMPAVQAGPHLRFANHWIGIYDGPSPMPVRKDRSLAPASRPASTPS
jgi:hypothetical protein